MASAADDAQRALLQSKQGGAVDSFFECEACCDLDDPDYDSEGQKLVLPELLLSTWSPEDDSACSEDSDGSYESSGRSSATDPAELAALEELVPLNDSNEFTSIGSIRHPAACSPCVFYNRNRSCALGIRCNYCHFPHVINMKKLRKVSAA
ncbi:unnamed protein product [Polarella glacialis]|uniref:C3H1-type domain-containing protein n=1 Tax=Polarella glacialis TaxID=89957 RepID=A0A813GXK7_POLGL|nr:unnamed protein product [Polarella glacialis]